MSSPRSTFVKSLVSGTSVVASGVMASLSPLNEMTPTRVVRGSSCFSSTRQPSISAASTLSPLSVLGSGKMLPSTHRYFAIRFSPTTPLPSMSAPDGSEVLSEVSITNRMSKV